MITDFWINLPVKNIAKSRAFFTELGFSFNTQYGNSDNSISLLVGNKNTVVMLFEEPAFEGFARCKTADVKNSAEVLLSVGVDSKEAVDELAKKAILAGGVCDHVPKEMQGWMYGCLIIDPDGHKWNPLYMDMSKIGQ
jgi:predicted lactoylglutathione lyase